MSIVVPQSDTQQKPREPRNRFETILWILAGVFLVAFFVAAALAVQNFIQRNDDQSTSALAAAAVFQLVYLSVPALFMSSTLFAGLALFARATDVNARRLAASMSASMPGTVAEAQVSDQSTPNLNPNAQVITQPTPPRDAPLDHSLFMRPPSDG